VFDDAEIHLRQIKDNFIGSFSSKKMSLPSLSAKRAVGVHATAVDAGDRFRHEGGQIAIFMSDEFHDLFEGLDVIASLNDIGETEVDFVLARARLRGGRSE
jgi:hypothetical protein